MKNKKLVIIAVAFVAVIAVLLGVYAATRPEAEEGVKSITVVVVHADGAEKTFEYRTEAENLADVLLAEGLVTGTTGEYGLTIESVDGEVADWNNGVFWAIYIGEESAVTGASGIMLTDGAVYKLVYESF